MPITLPTKAASPPQRIRFEDDIFTLPTTLIPIARGIDRFLHNNMLFLLLLRARLLRAPPPSCLEYLGFGVHLTEVLGLHNDYSFDSPTFIRRVRKPSGRVVRQDDDFQLSL